MEGGSLEDDPPWTVPLVRSFRHFHNPLLPIESAGYSIADSAVLWSQLPVNTQWPGGHYSWHDARSYYYNALTTTTKEAREENFAETFRAVGQVMHLVQDMSVPEHARNDGHALPAYEAWVAFTPQGQAATEAALNNPKPFDISVLRQSSPFSAATVPIARLFDSEQYNENSNPDITMSPDIGLAEYTNANFVSYDTAFTSGFTYPSRNPANSSVEQRDLPILDPFDATPTTRAYYYKIAHGETDSGQGYCLAGVDYLSFFRRWNPDTGSDDLEIMPIMDERVFADYARLLLPRAVGYSATLLQYFFRGDLTTSGIELKNSSGTITGLHLKIVNSTTDEALSNGNFIVSYRYRPAPTEDFVYGASYAVSSGQLNPPPNNCGGIYTFTFTQAIPATAVEPQYTLVFRGTLGHETSDAVIAKVVTLGPTGFTEEWNNGLTGNHTWLHTDLDFPEYNPDNGTTVNQVGGGLLVKENIRYAGHQTARSNESLIGEASIDAAGEYCIGYGLCLPYDFGTEFPVPITPCTVLDIKVDEMSVTPEIPYQSCPSVIGKGAYQGIILKFDNGVRLMFTVPGQEPPFGGYSSTLIPGVATSFNIFDAFAAINVPFAEGTKLLSINMSQQFNPLCQLSTEEHRQRMVVDYIRFE